MKEIAKKAFEIIGHLVGRITGKYYFEDYVRVYPDGRVYNRFGIKVKPTKNALNNYLNHCKFYRFVAQFANSRHVADVGCGSGYGCKILKEGGAAKVNGFDISKASIEYATKEFGNSASFGLASITDMGIVSDGTFDLIVTSEVLEHIKEYNKEGDAVNELKRVTKKGGIIIAATPNSELLGNHGFSFDEINTLFSGKFSKCIIFENALIPTNEGKNAWLDRSKRKNTGTIISQKINLDETVLSAPKETQEIKKGIAPGKFQFYDYEIDTSLLHNTHSWVVVAINEK